METVAVLDLGDTAPLHGSRDDHRGLPARPHRIRERGIDRLDVVAVDRDRAPAERAGALDIDIEVPPDHRLATLPEPVDVENRDQVVELVVAGVLVCLPHGSLGHLAVPAKDPDAVRKPLEVLPGDRHPDADRKALAERAGGDVDPGDERRRVPFEHAPVRAVLEHLRLGDRPGGAVDGVQQHGRVPLREHEPVVGGTLRVGEVVAEVAVHEHREKICGRHRGRRMSRPRGGAHPDGVDPELLTQLASPLCDGHRVMLPGRPQPLT
jgi:hypothetical protein